ncbi:MAG: hypothetical protein Q4G26_13445 [Paracoccus sp. (in: a-proteobacteria)]|nr:hypothetical protein [Paracoccus sp. (in: a-proteobacteria)]
MPTDPQCADQLSGSGTVLYRLGEVGLIEARELVSEILFFVEKISVIAQDQDRPARAKAAKMLDGMDLWQNEELPIEDPEQYYDPLSGRNSTEYGCSTLADLLYFLRRNKPNKVSVPKAPYISSKSIVAGN